MPLPLILSFGSVNIDVTARGKRLPAPGETVHAESYAIGLGGKGANQAAAAGRLGAGCGVRSALVGRIGADAFGVQAREALRSFGVDLAGLREDPGAATGLALIGIDAAAENCITVVGGANLRVDGGDVRGSEALFGEASVLLLQLEVPVEAVLAAARRGREAGARVVLDPAPAPSSPLPDELWPLVDVVTPNETETAALCGVLPTTREEAARAAGLLMARGVGAAVVKMGSRGVWWQSSEGSGFVSPFPVTAVDTVAAGDCFNAGLAVALALGASLGEAVRVAAATGALAVTKRGAADAAPEWGAVQALL
ncbi:ribokinase [Acetobacter conturbans]|uniref:Ribokinase n=1 Tax=Acetobacter conturbans TaxID=1737472 RepID=A0ABX0JV15_9PROT|nr:ribokinase [Acetobacter conturbans]NHN87056.1 ribokinase [Acetobacter conturbans]